MSRHFSMLLDTLRPNRGWRQRLKAASPEDRVKYWALRVGLAVLVVIIILLFNIQQHQALR
jgi:hypothetical protein